MSRPYLFKRQRTLLTTVHKVTTLFVLAALLAGLIPPPLVRSAVDATLPATLAQPVAAASQALLPAPQAAQAADLPPLEHQKPALEAAPAAPGI
ncbi:MAG: hypothetical protein U0350_07210 [Caldilineaceae bacterium]